jgi:hypothetical protein
MRILMAGFVLCFLSSCLSTPASTPIHDDFVTLVSDDIDLGVQKFYKNEKLNHYVIDGVHAYCKSPSMDKSLYRCFSIEGNKLTKGLNSTTSAWDVLSKPVVVVQKRI